MTLSAEWQRSNRFHIRNRTTFHSCHCQPQQETYYFHTPDLWSMWTQHNFFFYTQIQPFQIQPKKIKISKIWNSANSLFKGRFWIVVIQKFCYHGNMMWRLILPIEQNTSTAHIAPTQTYWSKREITNSLQKRLPWCNKNKHIFLTFRVLSLLADNHVYLSHTCTVHWKWSNDLKT